MSLAAVNQICVIHEAMNGCKKSKDSLKDCFENVNIYLKICKKYLKIYKSQRSRFPTDSDGNSLIRISNDDKEVF